MFEGAEEFLNSKSTKRTKDAALGLNIYTLWLPSDRLGKEWVGVKSVFGGGGGGGGCGGGPPVEDLCGV